MSILNVISSGINGEVDHMLYDEYDEDNKIHSMARVTGYPVIIMTDMILNGEFNRPGINIPEVLGQDEDVFNLVCARLKEQGIYLNEKFTRATIGC